MKQEERKLFSDLRNLIVLRKKKSTLTMISSKMKEKKQIEILQVVFSVLQLQVDSYPVNKYDK